MTSPAGLASLVLALGFSLQCLAADRWGSPVIESAPFSSSGSGAHLVDATGDGSHVVLMNSILTLTYPDERHIEYQFLNPPLSFDTSSVSVSSLPRWEFPGLMAEGTVFEVNGSRAVLVEGLPVGPVPASTGGASQMGLALVDLNTGKVVGKKIRGEWSHTSVVQDSQGVLALSASQDGLTFLDLASGLTRTMRGSAYGLEDSLFVDVDGKAKFIAFGLAGSPSPCAIYDARSGRLVRAVDLRNPPRLRLHANIGGSVKMVGLEDSGSLFILDTSTGKRKELRAVKDSPNSALLRIYTVGAEAFLLWYESGTQSVHVTNLGDGAEYASFVSPERLLLATSGLKATRAGIVIYVVGSIVGQRNSRGFFFDHQEKSFSTHVISGLVSPHDIIANESNGTLSFVTSDWTAAFKVSFEAR